MARTEEQKAADRALEAAIEQCIRAYQGDPTHILGDWLVIAQGTRPAMDEDGEDDQHGYSTFYTGGGLPFHRIAGLLEAGRALLHGEEMTDD